VLWQKLASLFLFFRRQRHLFTILGGRVMALDESPNAEISYSAEVIAEGVEATASKYMTAADRVYAVLPPRRRRRSACARSGISSPPTRPGTAAWSTTRSGAC
jgi:hypothetical protein